MPRLGAAHSILAVVGVLVLCAIVPSEALAQAPRRPAPAPASVARTTTPARPKFRKLAPNAMRTVNPQLQLDEGYERHDVVEVLSADPNYAERAWARGNSKGKSPCARHGVSPRHLVARVFLQAGAVRAR